MQNYQSLVNPIFKGRSLDVNRVFSFDFNLTRHVRSRKRTCMRVFGKMAERDQLDFVNDVFTDIRNIEDLRDLKFCGVKFSGIGLQHYLIYRLCRQRFVQQALISRSLRPVTSWLVIPSHWYKICEKHNLFISKIKSGLAWRMFGSFSVCYASYLGLKAIFRKEPESFRNIKFESSVFLHGVSNAELQNSGRPEKCKNLVNWIFTEFSPTKICVDSSSAASVNSKDDLLVSLQCPGELSFRKRMTLSLFIVLIFLRGQLDVLVSQGLMAVFSPEIVKKKIAMLMDKRCVSSHYYFPNSYYMYRPIWTDVMIERGAEVCLFFYSMNCIPFDIDGVKKSAGFGYRNMNWPICLVWNAGFAKFIQKASLNSVDCRIVKPIWFSDNGADVYLKANSVVVFDVNSPRRGHYPDYGLNTRYYSDEVTIQFFEGLLLAAKKFKVFLVVKRKRPDVQSEGVSKRIREFLRKFDESNDLVMFCDPGVSADRLLEQSAGAVSMPFTSPAQIAKAMEIPSIFFDPTSRISKESNAALGVPICSNQHELDAWFSKIRLNKNNRRTPQTMSNN